MQPEGRREARKEQEPREPPAWGGRWGGGCPCAPSPGNARAQPGRALRGRRRELSYPGRGSCAPEPQWLTPHPGHRVPGQPPGSTSRRAARAQGPAAAPVRDGFRRDALAAGHGTQCGQCLVPGGAAARLSSAAGKEAGGPRGPVHLWPLSVGGGTGRTAEGPGPGGADRGLSPLGHGSWSLGRRPRFAPQRPLRQPRKPRKPWAERGPGGPLVRGLGSGVSGPGSDGPRGRGSRRILP